MGTTGPFVRLPPPLHFGGMGCFSSEGARSSTPLTWRNAWGPPLSTVPGSKNRAGFPRTKGSEKEYIMSGSHASLQKPVLSIAGAVLAIAATTGLIALYFSSHPTLGLAKD